MSEVLYFRRATAKSLEVGVFGRQSLGFSLIEMLIVLTVLGVLLAVAAPNLFTLMQATSLSSEGNLVRNKLTLAQQIALTKNSDVEVRFFKFSDMTSGDLEKEYRAFQLFQFDERGELRPVSKLFRIKSPVYMTANSKYSTLLNPGANRNNEGEAFGLISPSAGKMEIPVGGEEFETCDYVAFRFRPDGSTDLPGRSGSGSDYAGGDTWFVTLVQGGGAEDLVNYYTIQVEPFNGKISVFRP